MSEEEIFHQARARRDPRERAAYLERACGGDATLRADFGAIGFMGRPRPDPDATVDAPGGERPASSSRMRRRIPIDSITSAPALAMAASRWPGRTSSAAATGTSTTWC
jgi:hypothetical protein